MAALSRISSRLFRQQSVSRLIMPLSVTQWYCKVAGSMEQTLSVKHRIDNTRERAYLGGGQRRIDNQHKKVSNINHFDGEGGLGEG